MTQRVIGVDQCHCYYSLVDTELRDLSPLAGICYTELQVKVN